MNEEEQQPPEVMHLGPGQILKQARERAGLTSQDIADKIKLKRSLIEDIEQDNYDVKISLTFIKGYLKLYAKHVDVAESDVVMAFENLNTQDKEPAKLQSFSRRIANQANDDKLMMVTYLIVAVVIALVVIWWFQQGSEDTSKLSEPATYSSESDTEITPLSEDTKAELFDVVPEVEQSNTQTTGSLEIVEPVTDLIQADITQNGSGNTDVAPAVEQTDNTNNIEVTETLAEQTVAPVELVFEFSGDCWMNLSDATGENIAYGVKVKGRVMPISGIPPFVVTLGAPEAVQIRYAGEALDMSFLTPGRIAKFELPLSE